MKIIGSKMRSLEIPGMKVEAGLKWRIISKSNWLLLQYGMIIPSYLMKNPSRGLDNLTEVLRGGLIQVK